MESGQMRVEANVSLRPVGSEAFGTRVEVKNMNSFRSVERAIDFEIERQEAALRAGEPLIQETRGWDDDRGVTYHMRTKETSDDYRYFPEPDLPPLRVDPAWLEEIATRSMPELPAARRQRYRDELGLSAYDADVLVDDAAATALFESARAADAPALPPKKLANWVTGEYLRLAKGEGSDTATAGPERPVAGAASPASPGCSSPRSCGWSRKGPSPGQAPSRSWPSMRGPGGRWPSSWPRPGSQQISDAGALRAVVAEVLAENPAAVADVRAGVEKAYGFLTGQVMRRTAGRADASLVTRLLRESLAEGPAAEAAAPVSGDAG